MLCVVWNHDVLNLLQVAAKIERMSPKRNEVDAGNKIEVPKRNVIIHTIGIKSPIVQIQRKPIEYVEAEFLYLRLLPWLVKHTQGTENTIAQLVETIGIFKLILRDIGLYFTVQGIPSATGFVILFLCQKLWKCRLVVKKSWKSAAKGAAVVMLKYQATSRTIHSTCYRGLNTHITFKLNFENDLGIINNHGDLINRRTVSI